MNFVLSQYDLDEKMSEMLVEAGVEEAEFCRNTYIGKELIGELVSNGHLIGAHGHSHIPLNRLGPTVDQDLKKNVTFLSGLLGVTPPWIAYPFGRGEAIPTDAISICKRHGFEVGFTTIPGWNESGMELTQVKRISNNELTHMIAQ